VIRSRIIVFMNKRKPFRSVLTELAQRPEFRDGLITASGEVNGSELARVLNVSQPTISRAFKNPAYEPSNSTVDAVSAYFGVTVAQARGEDSLVPPPADDGRLSARARNIAKRYEKLLPAQKSIIDAMMGQLDNLRGQQQAG
jgi:hypothetical protein